MTKPRNDLCVQRKLISSIHSDQSLPCPHEETLGRPELPIERTTKILIRLGRAAQADLCFRWAYYHFVVVFFVPRLV